jgi:hypothetical protein
MASRARLLVRDLLKLYALYNDKEIADALRLIRSGEAFRDFEELGEQIGSARLADRPKAQPQRSRTTTGEMLDRLVRDLNNSHSAARRSLAQLLTAARKRQILASSGKVRGFLSALDIPANSNEDRLAMLLRLGTFLSALNDEELIAKIRIANDFEEGSALQRWADIIVRRDS